MGSLPANWVMNHVLLTRTVIALMKPEVQEHLTEVRDAWRSVKGNRKTA